MHLEEAPVVEAVALVAVEAAALVAVAQEARRRQVQVQPHPVRLLLLSDRGLRVRAVEQSPILVLHLSQEAEQQSFCFRLSSNL
jgi:hypothetical protein